LNIPYNKSKNIPAKDPEDENPLGSSYVGFQPDLRSIYICGMIDDKMAMKFHQYIQQLERIDAGKNIKLFINSSGGFVNDAMYMIDVMQASPCPIATIACGVAMSAACMILAAGDEGKRYAFPHCTLMLHEISTSMDGKFADLRVLQRDVERSMETWINMLNEFTGKSKPSLKKLLNPDLYLTPAEAIRFGSRGLIDGIWPPEEEI
jgi:ATP-dependent Clp protease, protease subunit